MRFNAIQQELSALYQPVLILPFFNKHQKKTMQKIHAGVGLSYASDSFQAGKNAVTDALERINGQIPQILIVFGAMRFDHRELLRGIQSVTGDIPLVGGTTAGEISTQGFSTDSVVVMAVASGQLRCIAGIGHNMSRNVYACTKEMINDILSRDTFDPDASLLLFPNGMGGDGTQILAGIHDLLGEHFEVAGGYLGDDERFSMTFQYYNGSVYKDAIVGLMICKQDGIQTGTGVKSGFESIGNSFTCTASEGNVVKEFDHVRALDLYKDFLGETRSERLPGICLEYPFGIIEPSLSAKGNHMFQLRCGLAVNHETGTISLAASIPEGSAVTLTTASRGEIIKGALDAATQAKACLSGADPRFIIMFSCVGRKLVLGRRIQEEISAVKQCFGDDIPIIGFYTYGEIGPINKMKAELATAKFHNETVVLWVIGEEQA